MRNLLLILALLVLVGCAKNESFVRSNLPGWWAYSDRENACEEFAFRLSFSEDGTKVLSHSPKGASFGSEVMSKDLEYVIEDEISHVMRMRGIGELRKTDDGKVVKWDFVMKEEDMFCWHRTDWNANGCTKDYIRCNKNATNQ